MESNFEPCCSKTEPRNHHRFVRYADQEPNEPKCCEKPNEDFNLRKEMAEPMRPIGPWATGCPDWNPKNGLTGVTPVGEHYSMTRFSTNEWRQRNSDVLSESHRTFNKSIKCEEECKSMMARTHAFVDANQDDTTKRLKSRTHDVHKWQTTLTRAIKSMFEEISSLEEERLRIIRAMSILQMPESIATECIDRRCFRADSELVRDEVQEELIEEIALISEIRNVLKNTLKDIADHQIANRTSRERLENDWSDKKDAFEIDTINCGLNNRSDVTLFRPGVTRYMNEQSTEESWEHFTKTNLDEAESSRQKSVALRKTINAILLNASRDLRTKSDLVEKAFNKRIADMDAIRIKLETELVDCLRRLSETEKLIDRLTIGLKNLNAPMKVAHSRLDNRNHRLDVENCRDQAHVGLVSEVKNIQEGVSAMVASIKQAEDMKNSLLHTRGLLEREIALKRRTIALDCDRCMLIRSHFPSTTALSGYIQCN